MSYRLKILLLVILAVAIPVVCSNIYLTQSTEQARSVETTRFLQGRINARANSVTALFDHYIALSQAIENTILLLDVDQDQASKRDHNSNQHKTNLSAQLDKITASVAEVKGIAVSSVSTTHLLQRGIDGSHLPIAFEFSQLQSTALKLLFSENGELLFSVAPHSVDDENIDLQVTVFFSAERFLQILTDPMGFDTLGRVDLISNDPTTQYSLRSSSLTSESAGEVKPVRISEVDEPSPSSQTASATPANYSLTVSETLSHQRGDNLSVILRNDLLIAAILSTLVISALLWVLYRPLIRLAEQAKRLAGIDDAALTARGNELKLVEYALSTGLSELESSNERLETVNAELTNTVEQSKNKELVILNIVEDLDHERDKLRTTIEGKEKIERNLAEKSNLLESVLNNVSEGLIYFDAEGDAVLINPAATGILGLGILSILSTDNITNLEFYEEDGKTPMTQDTSPFLLALQGDGISDHQLFFVPVETGVPIFLAINANPIVNRAGTVIAAVSTFRDITERHESQKRIEHTNQELLRSNRDLKDFAYVASHDLRSPLRGIDNLAMWVLEDHAELLPEAAVTDLNTLRSRAQRLEKLLDGLLSYAQIDRLKTQPVLIDVEDLVRGISDLSNKPKQFTVGTEGRLPTLTTFEAPLTLVLRNLIQNAIKHRASDDGRVVVHCNESENPLMHEFSATDSGSGIPPEQLDKVFGLFVTLKRKDDVEASGLGLALVKRTVETMGGRVFAKNNKNSSGVTVTFQWPISVTHLE